VITRLNVGGPARQVAYLHQAFNEGDDYKSVLIHGSLDTGEGDFSSLIQNKSDVIYISQIVRPISIINDLIALIKLMKVIDKEDVDLIHSHTAKAGLLSRLAVICLNSLRRLRGKKRIMLMHTYHGHVFAGYFDAFKTKMIKKIESFLWRRTDAIAVLTESQQKEICSYLNVSSNKSHIVPLGLDLRKFLDVEKNESMNEKFACHAKVWVGWVGRLCAIKNPMRFLEIVSSLVNRTELDHVNFVIVGGGDLEPEIKNSIVDLNLEKRVYLYGWSDELPKVYSGIDMFFNTSDNEGTPVAVLESVASGVPVAATNVGGTFEVLKGRDKCWVFDKENWASEIDAWSEFLKSPAKIAFASRDKTVEDFSCETLKNNLQDIYQSIANP